MKKTFVALAALGAMAGAAQAQSTVTIYGLLDANFGSFKTNVASGSGATASVQNLTQTKIDSGGLNGSRWGIRFSEDVGDGTAVIGNLESGINLDAGSSAQGGLLFGRRANVGVSSGFGTLVIGRNSSPYDDVSADYTVVGPTIFNPAGTNNGPLTTAAAGLAATTVAATATTLAIPASAANAATFLGRNTTWIGFNTRFDNSVKYTTPSFGGFSASVMYAFGENKTQTVSASSATSLNMKYANGPLLISGGYQSEGATRTATAKPALENTLLSVAYDFGVAKVGAGFNRAKYKDVIAPAALNGGVVGGTFAAQKEWSLSVAVPLGATTLSAGYAQSKGDTLGKSTGYGVQALYSLSKRTTLYAGALSTKAYDKLAAAVADGSLGFTANTSSIGRTTTYAAGIRHTF